MSEEVIKAVLVALASVTVALIGLAGLRIQAGRPKGDSNGGNGKDTSRVTRFDGTQNEFMSIVIADNEELRTQIRDLKTDVEQIKSFQETFVEAVRRYLSKLHRYWGSEGSMPAPDDRDLEVLSKALPIRTDEVAIQRRNKQ